MFGKYLSRSLIKKQVDPLEKMYSDARTNVQKQKKAILDNKAKMNKKKQGKTVAEMILERSQENPIKFRFVSPGGREVFPFFGMFKKLNNKPKGYYYHWYEYDEEQPETFAQMAVLKLTGYKFSGHHIKHSTISENRFRGIVGYDKKWAVERGQAPDADTEKRQEADKIISLMKDTIWCVYMDTGRSVGLKPKDLFILETTKKRVNKKYYRWQRFYSKVLKHHRAELYIRRVEWRHLPETPYNMGIALKKYKVSLLPGPEAKAADNGFKVPGLRKTNTWSAFIKKTYDYSARKYTTEVKTGIDINQSICSHSIGYVDPNIRPR